MYNTVCPLSIIHREALASRHLSSELSEVMTDIIGVVTFIKTRLLKTNFYAFCEARWLSRGNVLSQVFELREQIRMFLEQEQENEVAEKFSDESFLAKLAYLSDIFGKLNEPNLQLQGKDKHLPQVTNKISSFTRKLAM